LWARLGREIGRIGLGWMSRAEDTQGLRAALETAGGVLGRCLRSAGRRPVLAIIGGSGQSELGKLLRLARIASCAEVPGLSRPTVAGHSGEIFAGRIEGVETLFFAGRSHLYEDLAAGSEVFAVRLCASLGIKRLVLLNSAGGLSARLAPGDLMVIRDVISLQFSSPLAGANHDWLGPRFPDMSNACDRGMSERLIAAGSELKMSLHQGVYASVLGPSYETRAEVGMLRAIGADAVGMSTAPEIIAAGHAGLRAAAVSCITNSHVRPTRRVSHEEVLENVALARHSIARLIRRSVRGTVGRRLFAGEEPESDG
jgi:purine-nucleoside phosphorylase